MATKRAKSATKRVKVGDEDVEDELDLCGKSYIDIACLYLVVTPQREVGKRVFKFGRSEKLKERFFKHSAAFGDATILDTVVFVPQDCLSEAETLLNHSISEDLRFALDEARELLLLDDDGYKVIRSIMRMIADRYNGSMAVHATVLESEMKDQEFKLKSEMQDQEFRLKSEMQDQEFRLKSEMKNHVLKYELRIKDLERMVEVLEGRVQQAGTEKEKRAEAFLLQAELKLAEEKSKAAAQLAEEKSKAAAQLAEEKSKTAKLQQQLDTQLENIELRMKVLKLEHAAELAEKDRRIAELEETNRRLGKNFPDAG